MNGCMREDVYIQFSFYFGPLKYVFILLLSLNLTIRYTHIRWSIWAELMSDKTNLATLFNMLVSSLACHLIIQRTQQHLHISGLVTQAGNSIWFSNERVTWATVGNPRYRHSQVEAVYISACHNNMLVMWLWLLNTMMSLSLHILCFICLWAHILISSYFVNNYWWFTEK